MSSTQHGKRDWRADGAELIGLVDRDQAGRPLYLLDVGEVASDFRIPRRIDGFTGPYLWLCLWRVLKPCWRGPGFTAVIRAARRPVRKVLAVVLHELAHHLLDHPRPGALSVLAMDELAAILPYGRGSTPPERVSGRPPGSLPWAGHGSEFLRVLVHVAFRSWRYFGGDLLDIAGQDYGLSSPLAYQAALGDEPRRRAGEPLTAIAASQPPPEYADSSREDEGRAARLFQWRQCRDIGQTCFPKREVDPCLSI